MSTAISRGFGFYALLLVLAIVTLLVPSSDAFGNATSVIWVSPSGQNPVYSTYAEAIAFCTELHPCKASLTFAKALSASDCEYRLIPGDYSGCAYPQCSNRLSVSFLPGGVYLFTTSFYGASTSTQITTAFGTALNSDAQDHSHPSNPANVTLSSSISAKLASTFRGATVRNSFSELTHAFLTDVTSGAIAGVGIPSTAGALTVSNLILVDSGLLATTVSSWTVNDCAFLNSRLTARMRTNLNRNLFFSEADKFSWQAPFVAGTAFSVAGSDILLTSPLSAGISLSFSNTTLQGFGSSSPSVVEGGASRQWNMFQTTMSNALPSTTGQMIMTVTQSNFIEIDVTAFLPQSLAISKSQFHNCTFQSSIRAPDSTAFNSAFRGDIVVSIASCSECAFTTSSLSFQTRPVLIDSNIVTSSLTLPSDGADLTNTNLTINASGNPTYVFSNVSHQGGYLTLTSPATVTFAASSNISLDGISVCSTCLVSAYNMELKKSVEGANGGLLKALIGNDSLSSSPSSWTVHSIQIDGATLDITELTSLNYKHDGLGINPSNNGAFSFLPSTLIWVDWALKDLSGSDIAPELGKTYVLSTKTNVSSISAVGIEYEFDFEIAEDTSVQFRLTHLPPSDSPIPEPIYGIPPREAPTGPPSSPEPVEPTPSPTSSASILSATLTVLVGAAFIAFGVH